MTGPARERCITCSDEAVEAEVVAVDGLEAIVRVAGSDERVAVDLVPDAAPGRPAALPRGHRAGAGRPASAGLRVAGHGGLVKYVDEYRSAELARGLASEIAGLVTAGETWRVMEVCGGHTHAIYRHGLEDLLPPEVELVHGPGCPVCVIPMGRVDDAIALAEEPDVTLATFGDMMRVPGGRGSLLEAKARGADVRMVYSPLDALALAAALPDRRVVFFAIGFETTAPATAVTLLRARAQADAELRRVLQPRHDRAAAARDPRDARVAGRRVHRARATSPR